jgi:hypothetical protein
MHYLYMRTKSEIGTAFAKGGRAKTVNTSRIETAESVSRD